LNDKNLHADCADDTDLRGVLKELSAFICDIRVIRVQKESETNVDWKINETDKLTPHDIDRQGSKLLIGNGYIGYRGTLEEFNKEQKTAAIVSGLYDQVGDQWREPVNLPNGCFVQVMVQGEPLHALTGKVIAHTQGVDMHSAVHERQTTFEIADGTHITIQARRFASLARHHLICMEYSIRADRECVVDILTGIDGDVWDINGPHLREFSNREKDGVVSVSAFTHENAVPVAVSESISFSGQHADNADGADSRGIFKEKSAKIRQIRGLRVQSTFTLHKFISNVTGLDSPDPLEASHSHCLEAASLGFEALLAEHRALWSQRWAACDITIDGDEAAQQALRFSMYHLLSIVPMHTQRASIPARGMSGQMYKGAIFWDTEIFMLPLFTHAFPEIARNLLLYRYHTLDGARRKAAQHGYRGAFYAWESQDNGDDACTLFNVTDVFTNRPMRTYFRDKQVHISADIVYAFWQYFSLTGDASIWKDGGAEVVFECARFFLSHIYYNPGKQRYEILDVTGPDEYHERVHNNAFTNRIVLHTFDVCRRVAGHLKQNSPGFLDELIRTLGFESDLTLIADVAKDLYQPDTDSPGGLIPQFDGYFALENVPLKSLLERKLHPHEYFGGGNGLATTTQIIKQADVVLMLYLFGERYSLETKSANWEYYEPRTEHGSSLSACSYSLVAAQIGKVDWAYKYFMKTATIDLNGDGKQYVGPLYIGGTHPAGNGGAWMSAVFGLCGIRYADDTLCIDPRLPAHWRKVTVPLVFRGQRLAITLSAESVTVKLMAAPPAPWSVSVGGKSHVLTQAGEINIPL
jgi:nigerose phosphorylase